MSDELNRNTIILTLNEVKNMSNEQIISFQKTISMFAKWKNIDALTLFEDKLREANSKSIKVHSMETLSGKGIKELKRLDESTIVNITSCRNTGYSTPFEYKQLLTRDEAIKFIQEDREERSGLIYKFDVVIKRELLDKKIDFLEKDEEKINEKIQAFQIELEKINRVKLSLKNM